jgi:hypothetical protein
MPLMSAIDNDNAKKVDSVKKVDKKGTFQLFRSIRVRSSSCLHYLRTILSSGCLIEAFYPTKIK